MGLRSVRDAVLLAIIDAFITSVRILTSLFPCSQSMRTFGVCKLALLQSARYLFSEQKEDRDKCIVHLTEATQLPSISRNPTMSQFIFTLFLIFFTIDHVLISKRSEQQSEDVQYSFEYLQLLRRPPFDSSDVPRNQVVELLVVAMGLQIQLNARDVTRKIEEMLELRRELLASDTSTDFTLLAFMSLGHAVNAGLWQGLPIQVTDEVIECLRNAVKVFPPHSYDVDLALAEALAIRFMLTGSRDDYEEARSLFEKLVDPFCLGKRLSSNQVRSLGGLTILASYRTIYFDKPEYNEETISLCRSVLGCASLPNNLRPRFTKMFAMHALTRFSYHGVSDGLQEKSCINPELVEIISSQGTAVFEDSADLEAVRERYSKTEMEQKILDLKELLSNTSPETKRHTDCLHSLALWYKTKFSLTDDLTDIEESIKYFQMSLETDPNFLSRAVYVSRLCDNLLFAFERTKNVSYLDKSISFGQEILGLKGAEMVHFGIIRGLVKALLARSSLRRSIEDLNEVIRLTALAVNNQHAPTPDRFLPSSIWADTARSTGHPSVLEAYEKAAALLQESLSYSPTLQIQHDRFVAMNEWSRRMPLDYASYQVELGQLEAAIETLERGRALLWSEMRDLRAPISEYMEEDLPLVKKLEEINQELEIVTMSITPSRRLRIKDNRIPGSDGMDAFGNLVIKQQKLVRERGALISQTQGRPGFERFWKPPSFATLQSAASHGPVIIINHCKWRSDILILLSNAPPSLIPTAKDFFDRASELKDQLLDVRNNDGPSSPKYDSTLGTVLSELYRLVGESVIQRLRELEIPEQSRIWWCPTSVFCSLPLHAMGPVPSTDEENVGPQYISDLYICSYTPTLSALIESRNRSSHPSGKPSLLLVAQPDESLPDAEVETNVVQALPVQVTSLISEDATSSAVVDELRGHRLVHFVCHGRLERANPFDASFKLHGSDRLTLLDIVRSQLPSAEFAFLAACHTAELTEESAADEGLHLVAAMQYCGFQSVVGTMWAVVDEDGPVLAKYFYKSIFSKKNKGIPYHLRSAEALRDAVQKLRKLRKKQKNSLERWVNFVHYGA